MDKFANLLESKLGLAGGQELTNLYSRRRLLHFDLDLLANLQSVKEVRQVAPTGNC